MRKVLVAMALSVALIPATTSAATILTTSSPEYLGSVDPATPSDPASEVVYISLLVGLGSNTTTDINGQTYSTSSNDCAGCPAPLLAGGTGNFNTSGPVLDLDVSNWIYLLAKYANVSYVWYVANLTSVDIPATLNNGQGNGLSHYALFNPTGVPDGGTTAGLLGLAMLGLGYLRRRMA